MSEKKISFTTVDSEEIHRFSKVAAEWWDEKGPFAPLHKLNPTRLRFIQQCLLQHFSSLEGIKILDIGCGGGLITEPLARLGAIVTGIDASTETIQIATSHAALMNLPIAYKCISAEELASEGVQFDVVLALEIVEHVADIPTFLKTCTDLVKSEGAFILSTLNKTWKSYCAAIVAAEYILGWVPKGTHDWNKFIPPSDIARILRHYDFHIEALQGLEYSILNDSWSLGNNLDVNYLAYCKKSFAR
jgi:2-polyprenyl-6-hydroxyphenyl methylase/3-demethylubiquinone-9 3-methyltransferase